MRELGLRQDGLLNGSGVLALRCLRRRPWAPSSLPAAHRLLRDQSRRPPHRCHATRRSLLQVGQHRDTSAVLPAKGWWSTGFCRRCTASRSLPGSGWDGGPEPRCRGQRTRAAGALEFGATKPVGHHREGGMAEWGSTSRCALSLGKHSSRATRRHRTHTAAMAPAARRALRHKAPGPPPRRCRRPRAGRR
jgi:hypothetical protein